MKTLTKIILLAMFVVVAIGGVMYFAKTRVEPPPVPTKQSNQYVKDLQKKRKALQTAVSMTQKDSVLEITLDCMWTFYKEDRIEADEMNSETAELLNSYIPFFVNDSYGKFQQSVWYESDHSHILDVIAQLRKVTYADKKVALNKSQADSLLKIQKIISEYRQAKALSHRTTYNGKIRDAKDAINSARQYANDPWLSNCTSLASALRAVRPSIAQSHYRYVLKEIEELSQYPYYSKDYYDNTLRPEVHRIITEYDTEASKLYGSKQDVDALRTKAQNYKTAAEYYYETHG